MSGTDPYASPVADPTLRKSMGWTVSDEAVLVQDGAEFPEMDLLGGEESVLVCIHRKIRLRSPLAPYLSLSAVVPQLLWRTQPHPEGWWKLIVGLPLALMAIAYLTSRTVGIHYWVGKRAEQIRRRWRAAGWILLAPALLLIGWFTVWKPEFSLTHLWAGGLTLLAALIALLVQGAHKINCARRENGWFVLSGVPRAVRLTLERRERAE